MSSSTSSSDCSSTSSDESDISYHSPSLSCGYNFPISKWVYRKIKEKHKATTSSGGNPRVHHFPTLNDLPRINYRGNVNDAADEQGENDVDDKSVGCINLMKVNRSNSGSASTSLSNTSSKSKKKKPWKGFIDVKDVIGCHCNVENDLTRETVSSHPNHDKHLLFSNKCRRRSCSVSALTMNINTDHEDNPLVQGFPRSRKLLSSSFSDNVFTTTRTNFQPPFVGDTFKCYCCIPSMTSASTAGQSICHLFILHMLCDVRLFQNLFFKDYNFLGGF